MDRLLTRLMIALFAVLIVVAVIPDGATALEFDVGSSPDVHEDEVIDDDLFLMGGSYRIDGDVTRDLFVLGGTVDINGDIGGSVHVASGTVNVNGDVSESVRVAAGSVDIRGSVGWDVLVAGGTVTIHPEAEIGNDLTAGSGSMTVDGDIGRDLRGGLGSLDLSGNVGRDVRVNIDNELIVRDGVTIDGDLRYESDDEADIGDDVQVGGNIVFDEREGDRFLSDVASWIGTTMLRLGWALVAGTVLVMLLPAQSSGIATRLQRSPFVSLLWGAAAFVVIPFLALFLMITIIGLPVGLILIAAAIVLLYLSQVIVGLALGRIMMPGSWQESPTRWQLWVAMALGVTIVLIVRVLPLPFGWTFWTSLLVGFLAFGAVWVYLTGLGVMDDQPDAVREQGGDD